MNNNFIAVIDSGVGGLNILESLVKQFPNENFLFFADEDFFPYGTKSKEELMERLSKILKKLLTLNIKALIIACNTASAVSYHLCELTDIPIMEIIGATSLYAIQNTKNNKIGVWATNGTINSNAYQNNINPHAVCYPVSASDLVPLIENNLIYSSECINIVRKHLEEIKDADTLILGCTHFPLLRDLILSITDKFNLISSNIPVENRLKEILSTQNLSADLSNKREIVLYTSQKDVTLKNKIERFDIKYNKIEYLNIENLD